MQAFTGPDALRIEKTSVKVPHLYVIGTIPGVIPLLAAARNGSGSGVISASGNGSTLHWRAPGSTLAGTGVRITADGNYLLRDGEDTNRWLRVEVDVSELAGGGRSSIVSLTPRFNNAISTDDITAGQAAAGNVESYTFDLVNQSNTILSQLTAWIDPNTNGIEISDDGAGWVTPISKATGLGLPDLLPTVSDTLHVRRTITVGAVADGQIETFLHFSWRG